jgi:hypothetical protein
VLGFAIRRGHLSFDGAMRMSFSKFALAGLILAASLLAIDHVARPLLAALPRFRDLAEILLLMVAGGAIYAALILLVFGRRWLSELLRS